MSQVYDYSFLLLFGAPRVCLWIEIRRYRNTIRIRISVCRITSPFRSNTGTWTWALVSSRALVAIGALLLRLGLIELGAGFDEQV